MYDISAGIANNGNIVSNQQDQLYATLIDHQVLKAISDNNELALQDLKISWSDLKSQCPKAWKCFEQFKTLYPSGERDSKHTEQSMGALEFSLCKSQCLQHLRIGDQPLYEQTRIELEGLVAAFKTEAKQFLESLANGPHHDEPIPQLSNHDELLAQEEVHEVNVITPVDMPQDVHITIALRDLKCDIMYEGFKIPIEDLLSQGDVLLHVFSEANKRVKMQQDGTFVKINENDYFLHSKLNKKEVQALLKQATQRLAATNEQGELTDGQQFVKTACKGIVSQKTLEQQIAIDPNLSYGERQELLKLVRSGTITDSSGLASTKNDLLQIMKAVPLYKKAYYRLVWFGLFLWSLLSGLGSFCKARILGAVWIGQKSKVVAFDHVGPAVSDIADGMMRWAGNPVGSSNCMVKLFLWAVRGSVYFAGAVLKVLSRLRLLQLTVFVLWAGLISAALVLWRLIVVSVKFVGMIVNGIYCLLDQEKGDENYQQSWGCRFGTWLKDKIEGVIGLKAVDQPKAEEKKPLMAK